MTQVITQDGVQPVKISDGDAVDLEAHNLYSYVIRSSDGVAEVLLEVWAETEVAGEEIWEDVLAAGAKSIPFTPGRPIAGENGGDRIVAKITGANGYAFVQVARD